MKEQVVALVGILERMEPLYLRVHALLQSEREALIQLDYERIYELLVEKDELISVLRSLDTERLRRQDQLSIILGLSHSDINLREIADAVQGTFPELSIRLLQLRTLVNQRISAVVDRISTNKTLIEKSVKNLQDIARNLSRALAGNEDSAPKKEHGVYDGRAKYSGPKQSTGSLVRKEL